MQGILDKYYRFLSKLDTPMVEIGVGHFKRPDGNVDYVAKCSFNLGFLVLLVLLISLVCWGIDVTI
ncbi:hypothetical protein E308F_17590 [Moorella sp. E308F]|nr:hypothetical protein E308F_17590 [Moorella sp. E308F]GEA19627.1 hypothetical protein E306M_27650 [Moorella sp. E306M]